MPKLPKLKGYIISPNLTVYSIQICIGSIPSSVVGMAAVFCISLTIRLQLIATSTQGNWAAEPSSPINGSSMHGQQIGQGSISWQRSLFRSSFAALSGVQCWLRRLLKFTEIIQVWFQQSKKVPQKKRSLAMPLFFCSFV